MNNYNNYQNKCTRYPPPTKELIELKKKRNETVYLPLLCSALTQEAKFNKNFTNAEWLFNEIMIDYKLRECQERYFTENDEKLFAKSISTMVRYASTPAKAMHYATLFFKEYNERIRSPSRELVIFTNLIFAHTNQQSQENMAMALNITKLVLQIGVYKIDSSCFQDNTDNKFFADPVEVFTTVTKRVLQHFRLTLSSDKTELVPSVRYSDF
jgi:hypothetical protein